MAPAPRAAGRQGPGILQGHAVLPKTGSLISFLSLSLSGLRGLLWLFMGIADVGVLVIRARVLRCWV